MKGGTTQKEAERATSRDALVRCLGFSSGMCFCKLHYEVVYEAKNRDTWESETSKETKVVHLDLVFSTAYRMHLRLSPRPELHLEVIEVGLPHLGIRDGDCWPCLLLEVH